MTCAVILRADRAGTQYSRPNVFQVIRMQYLESRSQRARCQEIPSAEVLSQKCGKPVVETLAATSPGGKVQRLYFLRRRSADCAKPFASALFARGTCEMENFSARASFRHVQCKE